jgi:hypothetical protein
VSVFKEAVVAFNHVLTGEAQRGKHIQPLKRLFYTQVTYWRRRAVAEQK